jgi:hypothetical protein
MIQCNGPSVQECVEWLLKAGISVSFYTMRTQWQKFYCCSLESKLGNKKKIYTIEEASLNACLHHIAKNHQKIFVELACPPWTKQSSLYA